MTKHAHSPGFPPPEPESLAQLRGDCARMAPHWQTGTATGSVSGSASGSGRRESKAAGTGPVALHGVRVPSRSARLLDGMSEYGD
ncbi:hypothetical protein DVA86_09120 [Streptomyces armeniacus]|uniref:Uncharacterized protein n=1 Tax=Streptomyces armeniacus TaxID=83291 RepID=A0A345XMB6_9ACTN|nr:hypothetical protein [Streptomyces armeniacus]AXK32782.1 hypothetical protein DVA86_09120 [Streptomyces armeniacus]